MAAPEVEWSALSYRSREIVAQVALRLAAGYSAAEIATILNHERPSLRHLELPPSEVKKAWVSERLKELRREIKENAQV